MDDFAQTGICGQAGIVRTARDVVAFEAALLADHAAGRVADSLCFHRVAPAVSLGRHQRLAQEVRRDWCDAAGVAVVRRISGGGALYLDPGQLGLSLVVPGAALGASLAAQLRTGAEIVAQALDDLGVSTRFKAPNDLETPMGGKIASVFIATQGGSTLLYATVILRLDIAAAMQALLVPTEKLTRTGLEQARERMAALEDILERMPAEADLTDALHRAAAARLGRVLHRVGPGSGASDPLPEPEWSEGAAGFETLDRFAAATLRLWLAVTPEGQASVLRFASDGQFAPADMLERLAEHLTGTPVTDMPVLAAAWLAQATPDCVGFAAADIVALLHRAVAKQGLRDDLGLSPAETSALMLAGDDAGGLARATTLLVPYCAKPAWCKWRHRPGCPDCGLCSVGEAYRLARDRNMAVLTITNYEHLVETLAEMQAEGVESYVGMCCGEFFRKRHAAFRAAGMQATLIDIEGATCYELKEEHLAYAGTFTAEAALDMGALRKVMAAVPVAEQPPALSGACACGKAPGKPARCNGTPKPATPGG
ncbi:lipoyl protein ligase domain-containing protein [Rhodobacter ferrooxidans]|uniref:Biotin/lipoate A/B protein ligase n=1 Tax=Rhodobacter ferrooxidans TaxID=371731 RepID=C8S599_9RHOB|nr:DUF116 domain-containing protein [Rhodobacter sp. SW2]EEW23832.1 biotin/lipoate A/B protein ligase [Rhodobacter sp. SW2]